jgi:hypothetical protein
MTVLTITDILIEDDVYVTVTALIEDAMVVRPQTMEDPEELGPGICTASFELEEDEILPFDEKELIDYIENLNLDWQLIPKDDDV